jgi:hypothetical protein
MEVSQQLLLPDIARVIAMCPDKVGLSLLLTDPPLRPFSSAPLLHLVSPLVLVKSRRFIVHDITETSR